MDSHTRVMWYTLDENRNPVPCDAAQWGADCTDFDNRKRVGLDHTRAWSVSTVFLGTDYSWGDGPPIVFETMLQFALDDDADPRFNAAAAPFDPEHTERYASWAEAEARHAEIVQQLKDWEASKLAQWAIDDAPKIGTHLTRHRKRELDL